MKINRAHSPEIDLIYELNDLMRPEWRAKAETRLKELEGSA